MSHELQLVASPYWPSSSVRVSARRAREVDPGGPDGVVMSHAPALWVRAPTRSGGSATCRCCSSPNGATAAHPLLLDATLNNNFSDAGESGVRVRLVPRLVDLSEATRESVMDAEPWTYRVMASELVAVRVCRRTALVVEHHRGRLGAR